MAPLTVKIPEDRRATGKLKILDAELIQPFADLGILRAGPGDAREIPFHIRHEHGHADTAEPLGNDPQGHGLAGAGSSGDKPVTIGHARQQ